MSNEKDIRFAIKVVEERIAANARNLADWFGESREMPEEHTGLSLFEEKYLKNLLDQIDSNYANLKLLMKELAEFKKELF